MHELKFFYSFLDMSSQSSKDFRKFYDTISDEQKLQYLNLQSLHQSGFNYSSLLLDQYKNMSDSNYEPSPNMASGKSQSDLGSHFKHNLPLDYMLSNLAAMSSTSTRMGDYLQPLGNFSPASINATAAATANKISTGSNFNKSLLLNNFLENMSKNNKNAYETNGSN